MKYFILRRALTAASIFTSLCLGIVAAATATSLKGLMYVGTLDRKLLVINENWGISSARFPWAAFHERRCSPRISPRSTS